MFTAIWEALKSAWNYLKKLWVKLLNWINNIVSWFRRPERIKKIEKNSNLVAATLKERLANGDYEVCNCLYDMETEEIKEGEIIKTEELEQKAKNMFKNKNLVIIE